MAKTILKYTIFVASPDDVADERQAVDEIVHELNLSFGDPNNLVIEVKKWETHSAPGVSVIDLQQVINNDIGDSYDLFIGILWKKFGTKTKSANSGTEEEFQHAYNNFLLNNNLQILFYFKTAPPKTLKDINISELQKVEIFKNSLSEKGVLYWEFDNTDNLKNFLRLHIPKRIETISAESKQVKKAEHNTPNLSEKFNDEELGYFDFTEIVENSAKIAFNSLQKITDDTAWLGERINEKTNEVVRITKSGNPNPIVVKEIFKRTALLMEDYSSRINIETRIFYSNFEDIIRASSNLINLTDDFYQESTLRDLEETEHSIFELINGIEIAIDGMIGFSASVADLPRIQKEINIAKRNLTQNLDILIEKLKQSKSLAEVYKIEIVMKIDKLKIEKRKDNNFLE